MIEKNAEALKSKRSSKALQILFLAKAMVWR